MSSPVSGSPVSLALRVSAAAPGASPAPEKDSQAMVLAVKADDVSKKHFRPGYNEAGVKKKEWNEYCLCFGMPAVMTRKRKGDSDETEDTFRRLIPTNDDERYQLKQLLTLQEGDHTYNLQEPDPDNAKLIKFIQEIDPTKEKRVWDDNKVNQCIPLGGKQGAFIFIPGGDIKKAKVMFSSDSTTGKAHTERDVVLAAFKMFSRSESTISSYSTDNNKSFFIYCFDNQSGILRGYDTLPLAISQDHFKSHSRFLFFGTQGFGTQITLSDEINKDIAGVMERLNDPKRRKEKDWENPVKNPVDKPEDDKDDEAALRAEKTQIEAERKRREAELESKNLPLFKEKDGIYEVLGDGKCGLYALSAAKLKANDPNLDLKSDETKKIIYRGAPEVRAKALEWLLQHKNDTEVQKKILEDALEYSSGDLSNLLNLRREKLNLNLSLDENEKTLMNKLLNDYFDHASAPKDWCGSPIFYALSQAWGCKIEIYGENYKGTTTFDPPNAAVDPKVLRLIKVHGNHYNTLLLTPKQIAERARQRKKPA